MAKKKHKKNTGAARAPAQKGGGVRLSQCMIVKDEERNIEKALSWGKGIVCEQIVVDTGSSDHTVEIAERMGAKVLHFEWIDDFSAAKNYAIEQAAGDWIAFLDADEYFPKEDASKLLPILRQITGDAKMHGKYLAISCPMLQMSDDGRVMDTNMHVRLFKNVSTVRYFGRIHEQISIDGTVTIKTEDIKIIHTGYSDSAFMLTDKSTRNIDILRAELEKRPDDLGLKLYLADSLTAHVRKGGGKADGSAEAFASEAEVLYKEVAQSDAAIEPEFRQRAYVHLLDKYGKLTGGEGSAAGEVTAGYEQICEKAIREFPDNHVIMCLYATILNNTGEHSRALDILLRCEELRNSKSSVLSSSVQDMMLMYTQMVYASQGLKDIEGMLKYTAVLLMLDKRNTNILSNYIRLLISRLPSYENVLEILAMEYDLSSREDKALIADAAKECGAVTFADMVAKYRGD